MNTHTVEDQRDWTLYWQERRDYALRRAEIASEALANLALHGQLCLFEEVPANPDCFLSGDPTIPDEPIQYKVGHGLPRNQS